MTNGQWLEIAAQIKLLSETCLLTNPLFPDDFFPVRGMLKIKSSLNWRLYLVPHRMKSWLSDDRPCLGLVLTPEASTASFGDDAAPDARHEAIELPNWPGLGRLRAALQAAADQVQASQILALDLSAGPAPGKTGPGANFTTRTRQDVSAHELLEMQASIDGDRKPSFG